MKRTLLRANWFLVLAIFVAASAHAASIRANHRSPRKPSADADVPLAVFQRVDKRLTVLDTDNQALRVKQKQIDQARGASRRKRMLHEVEHSPQSRQRLRTVNQLLSISSDAERTYKGRKQQYGARLFRDLHTKLAALEKPILHAQTVATTTAFDHDEKIIDARLLSVVMQFQGISGGYAGLACRPGSWACCQPRMTKDGKSEVRGCTWSCASRLTACRGGCLGPRIPDTVVAVKNAAPKLRGKTQRATLAANQMRKPKSADRATVAPSRTATGSE
jgi:hypothetical protein